MNPSISDIKTATCAYYARLRLSPADLEGPVRRRRVAFPRHVAMYLVRELTTFSMARIGERFGGRDHSSVLHGVRRVKRHPKSLADAEAIRRLLEASTSPRSALAQELVACRAIVDFIRSLPPVPVERDWMLLESDGMAERSRKWMEGQPV